MAFIKSDFKNTPASLKTHMRFLLALSLSAFITVTPALAAPQPVPRALDAHYVMHAGNLHAVDIDGHFNANNKNYTLSMVAKTVGMLGRLAPWEGDLSTKGTRNKNTFIPRAHVFASTWRGETERTTFKYSNTGTFEAAEIINEDGTKTDDPVDPALTKGTTDMLTSLAIMLAHYSRTGNCTIDVPSFDGKRKFFMRFADKGDGTLRPHPYSAFSGKARACTIEIVPIAGHWREKPRGWMSIQEQSEKKGRAPTLWIASPLEGAPVIPVRFDVLTKFGPIIMRLKAIEEVSAAKTVTPRNSP